MSFDEFKSCVDRRFIESWLDVLGDRLDALPDTPDGRQTGSFLGQLAVMAGLEERDLIGSGTDAQSRAIDFAMEAVARLWSLFPMGARSDFDLDPAELAIYADWGCDDSVRLNLRTAGARAALRAQLRGRLQLFPALSDRDRDALIERAPSVRSFAPLFTEDERQTADCATAALVMEMQRQMLAAQLQGSVRLPDGGPSELDLFAGLSAPAFARLRAGRDWIVPLLLAHRSRFPEPPPERHRDTVERVVAGWREGVGPIGPGATAADLERPGFTDCLWKLTFASSYEAARQLLLSEVLVGAVSGRDEHSRYASGFHFWHDLRNPRGAEISSVLLSQFEQFLAEVLPWWTDADRAEFLGRSPLCLFLELLRLGSIPEVTVEVVPDDRPARRRASPLPVTRTRRPGSDDRAHTDAAPAATPVSSQPAPADRDRSLRVFVSSTFRDMQEERDELVKVVFPQLRRLCQDRGVAWSYVDLRWGITEAQAERGEVLPICLREIERSRPYFIGLLGERYGWAPSRIPQEMLDRYPWLAAESERSLTALEILHGALNDPGAAGRSFFYLRDPAYVDSLPRMERSTFVEADPLVRERLQNLKDRIRASGLEVREGFKDATDLGGLVLEDFMRVIESEFPEDVAVDPLRQMAAAHDTHARSRAEEYVVRPHDLERLDAYVTGNDAPLVVLGDPGAGKSALLANWGLALRQKDPASRVIMHFTGADGASGRWEALVRHVLWELKRYAGLSMDIPERLNELRDALPEWLAAATAARQERGERIVLLLAGLDQLEDREGALDLAWLPAALPPGVRLLVSTLPGRPLQELERRGWPAFNVEPLDPHERERLVVDHLKQYARQLDPAQVARLAAAPQAANPLYLRTLLDELVLFGIHEQLDARIGHYLGAETIQDLYGLLLARCEEDYDGDARGLVGDTLSLLWAARQGLTETEILDMLGADGTPVPRALWSPFYLSIESALACHSGLLTFANDHLRRAVEARYLAEESARRGVRRRIADYFDSRETDRRRLDEVPWQLVQLEDWGRLAQRLADPTFLCALWSHDERTALACWAAVEAASAARIEDTYAGVIASPDEHPEIRGIAAQLLTVAGRLEAAASLWLAEARFRDEEGDRPMAAGARQGAGVALVELGRYDDALSALQQAEATFRELDDHRGRTTVLLPMAWIMQQRGQLREAEGLLLERERSLLELGDRQGVAGNLANRALVRRDLGDLNGALELLTRSEELAREFGDPHTMVVSLGDQATLELRLGHPDAALDLLRRMEQTCRTYGLRISLMASLLNQAVALRQKGELDDSLRMLDEHQHLCQETGSRLALAENLANRAHILRIRRQRDEALDVYRRAGRISEEVGFLAGVESCLGNEAAVLEDCMDLEGALAVRRREEAICRSIADPYKLALCLAQTAQLLAVPMGLPADAKPLLEEARRLAVKLEIESLNELIEHISAAVALASIY